MTSTQTSKSNRYYRALTMLAVLATLVAMLLTASKPSYAASTTFSVTNTNDSGAGSLRQAILDANAATDPDVIEFAIPGTGLRTIKPSTPLPVITDPVTIDGYSQQGAQENTKAVGDDAAPKIQLDGTNAGSGASGLNIEASNSVIKGLVINRFSDFGIDVSGARWATASRATS